MMLLTGRARRQRGIFGEGVRLMVTAGTSLRAVRRQSLVVEQVSAEHDLLDRERVVFGNARLRKPRRQMPLIRRFAGAAPQARERDEQDCANPTHFSTQRLCGTPGCSPVAA